jgi:hypothetical protein
MIGKWAFGIAAEARECYFAVRWFLVAIGVAYLVAILGVQVALDARDTASFLAFAGVWLWLVLPIAFVMRRDASRRWVTAFPEQFPSKAMYTFSGLSIVFFTRLTLLFIVCLALERAPWMLFSTPSRNLFPYLPIYIFLVAQLLAWSWKSLPGMVYVIPILALLIPAAFILQAPSMDAYLLAWGNYTNPDSSALLLFLIFATFALCVLAVYFERTNRCWPLPSLSELHAALDRSPRATSRRFSCPLEAQTWYEEQRIGLLLPAITLLLYTAMLAYYAMVFRPFFIRDLKDVSQVINDGVFLQSFPLLAFVISAIIVGAITQRDRVRYGLLRPASVSLLAGARHLAYGRMLTWTALPVSALAVAGFLLGSELDRNILWDAYSHGEASITDLVTILLGPCLVATLCAWLALYLTTRVGLLLVGIVIWWVWIAYATGGIMYLPHRWLEMLSYSSRYALRLDNYSAFVYWLFGLPAMAAWGLYRLRRQRLMPLSGVAALLFAWTLLTCILYMVVPPYGGVQDSTALFGLPVSNVLRGLIALAPAAALIVPFAALPLALARRRQSG